MGAGWKAARSQPIGLYTGRDKRTAARGRSGLDADNYIEMSRAEV